MDRTLRNTTATANTATNNQVNQGNRVGGFKGKRHDLATKNKISQTQKARYDYMRQMMKQQQNEQANHYGPLFDIDDPKVTQRIKDIVKELLKAELKNAIPSNQMRQNIPIF